MKKRPTSQENQSARDKAIIPEQTPDLFPETIPKIAPRWPNPHSLAGEALARMFAGERLTQITFGLNRWRLSAYIHELKSLGWPIERMDVLPPNGYDCHRFIRQYWFSAETIAEWRERQRKGA